VVQVEERVLRLLGRAAGQGPAGDERGVVQGRARQQVMDVRGVRRLEDLGRVAVEVSVYLLPCGDDEGHEVLVAGDRVVEVRVREGSRQVVRPGEMGAAN